MPDGHRIESGPKLLREFLGNVRVDQETVGCNAGLPGIAESSKDGAIDGRIQVGVFKHDVWSVAAQLQQGTDHTFGGHGHDLPSNAGGSRETDGAHGGMTDQGCGNFPCRAMYDVHNTGREAGVVQDLEQPGRGERCLFRDTSHHGAACSQHGSEFAGLDGHREIPRCEAQGHPDGFAAT